VDDKIFRQKSLDKISSPEDLDSYIKVANPGVWMILLAIILFLTGVCFWGVFGSLNSSVIVPVVSDGSRTICYVDEAYGDRVNDSSEVDIDGQKYSFATGKDNPVQLDSTVEEEAYILHLMGQESGDKWVYEVELATVLPAGSYSGWLIDGKVNPIKYVLN